MLIPPEIYNEMQELVELQDHLYDLCEENYSEFFEYLSQSPFLSDSIYVRKLLLCIYSAFRFNFKNTKLLCRILVEIKDYLQKYLTSDEIVMNLRNNAARVALFECGLINIESIIKDSNFNNFCFRFFYPEIKEHDEKFYNKMLKENRYLKQSMVYLAPDVNLHKELRRLGKSEHKITQLIRDDDIDAFQEYISHQNFAITEQVPYSVYDTNDFANNEDNMPFLIECSAFYGAINIFKYIFMSLQSLNIELPTTLPSFAVAGGNYDIIHIVEEYFKKNEDCTKRDDDDDDTDDEILEQRINNIQNIIFQYSRNGLPDQVKTLMEAFSLKRKQLSTFARSNVIQAAIEFHRDNVLEYIIDGYSPKAEKLWQSSRTFISTIQFLNFRQMIYFLTSDEDKKENSSAEDSEVENDFEEEDSKIDKEKEGKSNNENEINKENESKSSDDDDKKEKDNKVDNDDNDKAKNENKEVKNDTSEIKSNDEIKNEEEEEESKKENNNDNDDDPWIFDINLAPKQGYPPIIQSVFESRIDVIRFLLSTKNIDVNITTRDGCSSLMLASMYGYVSIVKLLCEMKRDEINFNQTNNNGSTAFMIACQYGRYDIVKYLASLRAIHSDSKKESNNENDNQNNINENKANENRNENEAVENSNNENQTDEINNDIDNNDDKELFELIIDINKANNGGYSPFYVACMNGSIKIVKFLASFKDIKMIQNGKDPYQIAKYSNHQDVLDFLDNNPTYQEQKKVIYTEKKKEKSEMLYPGIELMLNDDDVLNTDDDLRSDDDDD